MIRVNTIDFEGLRVDITAFKSRDMGRVAGNRVQVTYLVIIENDGCYFQQGIGLLVEAASFYVNDDRQIAAKTFVKPIGFAGLIHEWSVLWCTGVRSAESYTAKPVIPSALVLCLDEGVVELFRQFFHIAFLMGKPQDVPAGITPLRIGLVGAFVTYVLALVSLTGMPTAVLTAVVDLVLLGLLLHIALRWFGREERFVQAYAAFCGASVFVNLAALPIYLSFSAGVDPATVAAESRTLFDIANFVLMVWTIALLGHIVRHTFEVGLPISILTAYAYVMLLTFVLGALFSSLGLVIAPEEQLSVIQLLECLWWCVA